MTLKQLLSCLKSEQKINIYFIEPLQLICSATVKYFYFDKSTLIDRNLQIVYKTVDDIQYGYNKCLLVYLKRDKEDIKISHKDVW